MEKIAPGVYVKLDYEGANVGCILTDAGAIVVDTPLIPAAGETCGRHQLCLPVDLQNQGVKLNRLFFQPHARLGLG